MAFNVEFPYFLSFVPYYLVCVVKFVENIGDWVGGGEVIFVPFCGDSNVIYTRIIIVGAVFSVYVF